MAQIKNFGLVGVGSQVQFGKGGAQLKSASEAFSFHKADGATFAEVTAANVVADSLKGAAGKLVIVDAAGKLGLDTLAATELATDAEVTAAVAAEATLRTDADALIRTDFAAADTQIRTDFAAADTQIRTDFAAADTALSNRLDVLEGTGAGSLAALQTEVDAVETAVGLNADGTMTAFTGMNYLVGETHTTLKSAVEALDAAIKARADAIAAEITRASQAEDDLSDKIDQSIAGLTWENAVDSMVADIAVVDLTGQTVRVYDTATNKIYNVTNGTMDAGELMVEGAAFFDRATDRPYVYNGTQMVQFNGAAGLTDGWGLKLTGNRLDLDLSSTGGLEFTTDADPEVNNTVRIKLADTSLTVGAAGLQLSTALQTEITALRTDLGTEATNRTNADTALQGKIDTVEASVGLTTEGALPTLTGSHFTGDTTLVAAVESLSAALTAAETKGGAVAATQIAFGDASGNLTSDAGLTFDGATDTLTVGTGTGGLITVEAIDGLVNVAMADAATKGSHAVNLASLKTAIDALTTSDIEEGTNLYYTQARFDAALAAKSTTDLAEGTNLYYTQARFDTAFAAKSTTDLAEGTKLFYTDARARAALSAVGTGFSYDSATGVFTLASAVAATPDTVAVRTATGTLTVAAPTVDTDAATKKYVDDSLNAVVGTGQVAKGFVATFEAGVTKNIPAFTGMMTRVKVKFTAEATNFALAGADATSYVASADVDGTVGTLTVIEMADSVAQAMTINSNGAGVVVVEYLPTSI